MSWLGSPEPPFAVSASPCLRQDCWIFRAAAGTDFLQKGQTGKSKAGIFVHQTDLVQGRVKSKSQCQDLSLWLVCCCHFSSGTAMHHLGIHESNSVAAGDGFQQWNQKSYKSTISFFHFEVRIKILAPDSTVLGQGKEGIRLLLSNAAPSQLGQALPHLFPHFSGCKVKARRGDPVSVESRTQAAAFWACWQQSCSCGFVGA